MYIKLYIYKFSLCTVYATVNHSQVICHFIDETKNTMSEIQLAITGWLFFHDTFLRTQTAACYYCKSVCLVCCQ